jgi:5-methyltetrahydrofolate--homocysteine methyltransferase
MRSLLNVLKEKKILISDGAWGTFLYQRGLKPGECPELWNITHREDVFAIAKSYIDAGADMILTNSFGGSPFKLDLYGLKNKTIELNETAAAISREAAGNDHFVLGSIGPTGVILMMGEVTESELSDGFYIQAEALKNGGADAICIETMSDIDEACIAIQAAKRATGLETVCTFTFDKTAKNEYRTMMGISPTEMVKAVKDAGANIIGTNCGNGFIQMIDIVREIRKADNSIPVLVHANAGLPIFQDGKAVYPDTPEMMAANVNELIKSGANIIGGCCGTTPAHISAIADAIRLSK